MAETTSLDSFVERVFELFTHAACSLAVEAEAEARLALGYRPRRAWWQDPAQRLGCALIVDGVDKRTGLPTFNALAYAVVDRLDNLSFMAAQAKLDLLIDELERRLWAGGQRLGVLKNATLIIVAPRGYARGGFKAKAKWRRYYVAAIVDPDPERALVKALKILRTWMERRLQALADALDWREASNWGLRGLLYYIRYNIIDRLSEGLSRFIKVLAGVAERVDDMLGRALKLKELKDRLGELKQWVQEYVEATLLHPVLKPALALVQRGLAALRLTLGSAQLRKA